MGQEQDQGTPAESTAGADRPSGWQVGPCDDHIKLGEHMLIVCGPSGVGKSTLVKGLLERTPQTMLSVSYTTRPSRANERDGVHYHFVDRSRFEAMIAAGAFAEWAEVHGNLYGTARTSLEEARAAGRDVVFDIDYQGARQLKAGYPGAWGVLVFPPSLSDLEARLRGRGTESEEVVARRLAKAREELAQVALFDFVLVNDDLERAAAALQGIYAALRLRRWRGAQHAAAVLGEDFFRSG